MKLTATIIASLVLCSSAFAEITTLPSTPRHEKTFRNLSVPVPKLHAAPKLDGTVDPAEWANTGVAPRMTLWERGDLLTDTQGRFY
jgi:hypothetical protein